ncbi:hypothetical protein O0L34_g3536 [Tuta absoluta]|nr:hypothetical protein O0L34_g3536 [Tuta absoluta]
MTEEAPKASKAPMTDEERLALAKKLDEDLDDFINGLEKKRYTDGWSEDTWEEEMDKHPFFMKSTPEGAMSPLAEGLAKLKYDPDENTPAELAANYKEDGNYNFKYKNYRLAILGYTEGIKVKCDDPEMNASLYNNRAASHFQLENYRSSLADSEKALTFNPHHSRARMRAAKSAYECAKYDKCMQHCIKLLETHNEGREIKDLLTMARMKERVQKRDQRKKERSQQKCAEEKDELVKAIIERKIRIASCEDEDDIDLGILEPVLQNPLEFMVNLKDGILHWPVLILYREHQMTDLIRNCPENVTLRSQLQQLFPTPWDKENKYSIDNINVYFEGWDLLPHIVDVSMKLGDLLVTKYYELKAGTPCFLIVPKGSAVEKGFLESYK